MHGSGSLRSPAKSSRLQIRLRAAMLFSLLRLLQALQLLLLHSSGVLLHPPAIPLSSTLFQLMLPLIPPQLSRLRAAVLLSLLRLRRSAHLRLRATMLVSLLRLFQTLQLSLLLMCLLSWNFLGSKWASMEWAPA